MRDEKTITIEEVPAVLRARQRGINHLTALVEGWYSMTDQERRESAVQALSRLENPY